MNLLRTVAGLIIGPFAGLMLFVIVASALNPGGDNYLFGYALMVAYLITLVFGVPGVLRVSSVEAFALVAVLPWGCGNRRGRNRLGHAPVP